MIVVYQAERTARPYWRLLQEDGIGKCMIHLNILGCKQADPGKNPGKNKKCARKEGNHSLSHSLAINSVYIILM